MFDSSKINKKKKRNACHLKSIPLPLVCGGGVSGGPSTQCVVFNELMLDTEEEGGMFPPPTLRLLLLYPAILSSDGTEARVALDLPILGESPAVFNV